MLSKIDFLLAVFLFWLTVTVYLASNPEPRLWYDHYVHLTYSLLQGRVDVPTLPDYYHDVVRLNDKTYLPFGPSPALIMLPAIALLGLKTPQPLMATIIGGLNITLLFLLLRKLEVKTLLAFVLSLFMAFGTVHWYAAVIGTTWFFAHIVGIFFLLSSLLLQTKNKFMSGVFLGLAALARYPTLLSAFSFLNFKNFKKSVIFLVGLSIFAAVQLFYNWARFGNILQTGYQDVYSNYATTGSQAGFYRSPVFSFLPSFALLDLRNIPLHLYTLLLMPPERLDSFPWLRPSPYGMSVLLTSPLLLYLARANLKSALVKSYVFAILPILLIDSMHYSQGWVQFGYRFILDYIPFLILILSQTVKRITPVFVILLIISILINLWGVQWGIKLGW